LLNTGQLDTVVLLLDVIGSIVISLRHCCLPNDEGPGPQIFFPRTAPAYLVLSDLVSPELGGCDRSERSEADEMRSDHTR